MTNSIAVLAVLFFSGSLLLFGADEAAKPAKKKKAPPSLAERTIKRYDSVKLTPDQLGKIEEAAKSTEATIAGLKAKAALTDEQKKAQKEASKAAKDAGKNPKEAREAVKSAVALTDSQVEAQKKMKKVNVDFNKTVLGLLTDEQKSLLKKAGKKAKEKS